MRTQPNINGVTLEQMTALMNKYEKILSWYNKKYDFLVHHLGTAKEIKHYNSISDAWEFARTKRDQLKYEAFKTAA